MELHLSTITNQNPNSSTSSSSSSLHPRNKQKGITGNTKRSRSTATKLSTDPQSVAARERRHRISDRFKILQSMVPGGAKMDTVSMLDEAIQYVKFLKAQVWLHQNMMAFFNQTTSFHSPPGHGTGVIAHGHGPSTSTGGLVSIWDADYAPVSEAYSQAVPPEYTSWFGSVDQEAMHRRGLS